MATWEVGFRSSNGSATITQGGHRIFNAPIELAAQIVSDRAIAAAARAWRAAPESAAADEALCDAIDAAPKTDEDGGQ